MMTVGQTESKLKARGIGKPHWYGAMYQAQRTDLLPLIPKSSRCVLDVGCCTGNLGAILKERGAYVAGVEIDAEAADHSSIASFMATFLSICSILGPLSDAIHLLSNLVEQLLLASQMYNIGGLY